MINSLLDTDLYKISMMQAVLHQFPGVDVEYNFRCRNKSHVKLASLADDIQHEVNLIGLLEFSKEELDYLSEIRFFKPDFIDFLRLFRLNPQHVHVSCDEDNLSIRIKGPWLHTIMWEVPLLALVNELYFQKTLLISDYASAEAEGKKRLFEKIGMLDDKVNATGFGLFLPICEFGTRRRWSFKWQEYVLRALKEHSRKNLVGTSNVLLAKNLGLTPIGTMAHEFLQAGQALARLSDSQKFMLEAWVKEYRGDLGIALSDVVGIDAFLRDFDLYFAKLYDGVRHDSGDPFEFGKKVIAHYERLKIDPRTKTLVFSDSLDIPLAHRIWTTFREQIKVSFGIGTNLTNDMGKEPLNVVIKMVRCNGQPVAKLSDSPGKVMCEDDAYVNYLKGVFDVKG